jgi:hypothetical protein
MTLGLALPGGASAQAARGVSGAAHHTPLPMRSARRTSAPRPPRAIPAAVHPHTGSSQPFASCSRRPLASRRAAATPAATAAAAAHVHAPPTAADVSAAVERLQAPFAPSEAALIDSILGRSHADLAAEAAALRDLGHPRIMTFSPKV